MQSAAVSFCGKKSNGSSIKILFPGKKRQPCGHRAGKEQNWKALDRKGFLCRLSMIRRDPGKG